MTLDPDRRLGHLRHVAELSGLAIDEFVLPTSRHLVVDGLRLHYLDWGVPAAGGSPILFLHGGALTAHTWDIVCLALRDGHHCIALDQRGHGDSEWSPTLDYSREAHVADLEGFVDELRLDRFVLVGHSLGGLNSIEYAARHSKRLNGVVIVDVGPELRTLGTQRISDFIRSEDGPSTLDDFVESALRFNERRDPELLRTSLLYNLRELTDGGWSWKYDRRHFGRVALEEVHRSMQALAERLPAIECPALVIRGAESDVFHDEDAEGVVARLPHGRWVKVAHAGHTVQGDNPRGLVEALEEFLEEIGATSARETTGRR